jgi:branched-chain amino acid transport system permease protein
LAGVVVVLAPWVWGDSLGLSTLSQIGVAVLACLSFNLLLGQGGMLSFGHATYTGAGAFAAVHVLQAGVGSAWAVPVPLLPLVGGLAGMVLAALLGWLCTRRPGTVFAMITLGLGELAYAAALMLPQVFGGEAGISANRTLAPAWWGWTFGPALQVYYLVAAYTLASAAALYLLTFTTWGRLLNAVRDNPQRVECLGLDPRLLRYQAFVVAGFFAGIAGALGAVHFETANYEALASTKSGAYLLFTTLGGSATFYGPVLGGVLLVVCTVLLSGVTQAWLLYVGLLFVAVVVWVPGGLAACLQTAWHWARGGQLRNRLAVLVPLFPSAAAAGLGLVVLIEMVYHWQLAASVGPELLFLGLQLNTSVASTWLLAAATCALGGCALAVQWRRSSARWRQLGGANHA